MAHMEDTSAPPTNSWEKVSMPAMAPYTVSAVTVTVAEEPKDSVYLQRPRGRQ